jgi:Alpha galactosidase A/NPCBM-associated, NEW3 domain of alpha-galactosidase/Alpha galactosidase C-terminal beta sandwich domain/Carbohydrate binding module (family 35)
MKRLTSLLAVAATTAALLAALPAQPAQASDNGVGLKPLLGWSSWSFVRRNPTAQIIEDTADAMVHSGLTDVGYKNVNIDDFWYICPGSQGPNVDEYGRWVTDPAKFPAGPNGENGIKVVADYVHSLGLKFGLYATPGISHQAVVQNTAIEGTPYHADDIATTASEKNYNCKGMVGIDYSKPGAQAFINSWADQWASWGVDYVKLDGVGSFDVPDVQAWSDGLRQTGRPIHLELSNSLDINYATTWAKLANGWRTGGDVECYCGPNGSSYPLTDWSHVSARFNQAANWAPYGGPGGFNDYDSIEVGNGSNDGLTVDERKTQMSLWALAASPFILGTDLRDLDPADLALLKNTDVLAVDQDAIDATRVYNSNGQQIFTKQEPNGEVIAGLFNTSGTPQVISTSATALGLAAGTDYFVKDLWSHQTTETVGPIAVSVPAHGVALYRLSPDENPTVAPPNATLQISSPGTVTAGQPGTVTTSFTDNGDLAAKRVQLSLDAPAGWTVDATSPTSFSAVDSGHTVSATFDVVAPAPSGLFDTATLTGRASYTWSGKTNVTVSATAPITSAKPVQAPYRTYSSAADAPAVFAQSGDQFGIIGAGADLWSNADAYSSIYLPGAVGTTSTVDTVVSGQQGLTGYGKAGIIVRNDMTGSGTSPEGVALLASPQSGIQLQWNSDGDHFVDSVTPANGVLPFSLPIHLKLERTGLESYTGYYSYDGAGWYTVGTANVPGQAVTQDAGMFVTSHASGSTARVSFDGFAVADGAVPPPPGPKSYEAEAGTLAGGARVSSCSTCSGGRKVGYVGSGGTLTFNGVTAPADGTYNVTIAYLDGSTDGRQATVSVNGGPTQLLSFTPTGSFSVVGTKTVALQLAAGSNTIQFANPAAYAPDFDRILVAATPS